MQVPNGTAYSKLGFGTHTERIWYQHITGVMQVPNGIAAIKLGFGTHIKERGVRTL